MNLINEYEKLVLQTEEILSKIYSSFNNTVKKIPKTYNGFRWVNKPSNGKTSFVLYGKYITIQFSKFQYHFIIFEHQPKRYSTSFFNGPPILCSNHSKDFEQFMKDNYKLINKHITKANNDIREKKLKRILKNGIKK